MIDPNLAYLIDWKNPKSWTDTARIIDALANSLEAFADEEKIHDITDDMENVAIAMRRYARKMDT